MVDEKVQQMQAKLKPLINTHRNILKHDALVFKNEAVNRYHIPALHLNAGLTTERFIKGVVAHKYQTLDRFENLIVKPTLDIDYFINLRKQTEDAFPGVYDMERLVIYSLYILDICDPNDITPTILNDPTTHGFARLADKRLNQLKSQNAVHQKKNSKHPFNISKRK